MKSKTHIIILHMREIVYTIIFSILAIFLIILLIYMFGQKDSTETMSGSVTFTPGVYTSSLVLENQEIHLQITVEESGLTGVSLVNPDEAILARYPLLETCVQDISDQLANGTALNEISHTDANQYTMTLLLESINNALQKAAP